MRLFIDTRQATTNRKSMGKSSNNKQSVWDYPIRPSIEPCTKRIQVISNGVTIADSNMTYRVAQYGQPPMYYFPLLHTNVNSLKKSDKKLTCDFKGLANYFNIKVEEKIIENSAFLFHDLDPNYTVLQGYIAFDPSKFDECYVDEERVTTTGNICGWQTSDIIIPYKE